ncbi:hypothetical protein [Jiangella asiatica]|uniref:DUF1080 domain-containing protein n=1 Tax=Jiangella asiatica TaxID=2530372 RepID=A0A4R5DSJ9_9ACTN|nr:hypothetical protein [Jiangella asiatica]TDE15061.1 hypothetical protein E1269_02855 [Jiangella asiatica]
MRTSRRRLAGLLVAPVLAAGLAAGLTTGPAANSANAGESLFAEDFSAGMGAWRAVTGSLDEWRIEGTEFAYTTVDTLAQTSGRYITPDPALVLPEAYEVRVRARVDDPGPGGSVPLNVLADWTDTSAPTRQNLSLQLPGGGGMRMAQPIAGQIVCSGPAPLISPGEWFDIVLRRAGGILVVEINDQRVAAVRAGDTGGTVGLGVYRARTSVDSVVVEALDGVPDDHPTEPSGCDWSPPGEPDDEQPVLLNQSGFNTSWPKRFTAPKAEDGAAFTVVDADGTVRFSGTVHGGVGDFSAFRPGAGESDFRVVVDGEAGTGESVAFGIGPSWLERVSYENAVEFMTGSRCYFGDAAASDVGWNGSRCRWSVMWRDGDTYSFEVPTLIDLFSANPAAFEGMRFDDAVYQGMAYELPADTPEVVRLIAWGVDRMLAHDVNHTLWKGQLAAFLRAYPDLAAWIPVEMYEDTRDYLFPLWSHQPHDRFTSAYDYTPHTADLFQTYTQVGTGKGELPPGHSIRPNLDMHEVALREGRDDADAYLDAARRNAAWIVDELDWNDPRTTKGQRMSEHVTVTGLVDFLRRYPGEAPAGTAAKITQWASVAVARSANLWDFRRYSDDRWTIPSFSGGGGADPNETGNLAGLAAPALAAASVVDDPELAGRLREIAVAAVDNVFGRNPTGRHASYRAPTQQWGFEGVELGWYSEYQGGAGLLQGIPGVLDGSPKNAHYPFAPTVGNIGHSEGWVAFNMAWNASLAWLADTETAVRVVSSSGEPVTHVLSRSAATVELTAPLDLDTAVLDEAEVRVRVGSGPARPLPVRQVSPDTTTFAGPLDVAALGAEPGDVVTVSYGLGSFTALARVTVEAADACPDGHASDVTVTFGAVDSGVPNRDRGDGCTFLDVVEAQGPFADHGALVRAVRTTADGWREDGLLTRQQSQDLLTAAAASGRSS